MISDDEPGYQVSYWPSVSDLFMTLFIIAIALVGGMVLVFLPDPAEKVVVAKIIEPINQIRAQLDSLPPLNEGASAAEVTTSLQDTATRAVKNLTFYKQVLAKIDGDISVQKGLLEKITALQTEIEEQSVRLEAARKWQEQAEQMGEKLKASEAHINKLEQQVVTLELAKDMRLEDKPPIITIADADKRHFFASGSAALTLDFEADLGSSYFQEIASEILRRNSNNQLNVDTLEVIGHTDGIPVASRGNLDAVLPSVLSGGEGGLVRLTPGSNNDLGLLRALAIKQAWVRFVARHSARSQLEAIDVRTYSAGQTIPVERGRFAVEDARSRRIELRLTKLR